MSDSYIQSGESAGGVSPQSVTLAGVTAGSRIVAWAWDGAGAAGSPACSDGQGSYTAVGVEVGPDANSVWAKMFELKNANAGSHVISFSWTGGGSGLLIVAEIGAHVSTSSTSNGASQNAPGTGANAVSTGSITISTACTVAAVAVDTSSGSGSDEPTAGTSPFTLTSRRANVNGIMGAWRLITGPGAASGAATANAITGTNRFIIMGLAVPNLPSASGGGPLIGGLTRSTLTEGRLIV